jgi:glycine oxidase
MSHIAIIGCGVIGAAIAYELSRLPGFDVTVLDRQDVPAQDSTSAALGVLMGAISQKVKGRNWKLRQSSLQRYETLIPELETLTGLSIPFNRQGILMLCFEKEMEKWQSLAKIRQTQGWQLEILTPDEVQTRYPHLNCTGLTGAIYSPQDRQLDPVALTQALVAGAHHNGVNFQFGVSVEHLEIENGNQCRQLHTSAGMLAVDAVVIAAGLGTTPLTTPLQPSLQIRPVLGQALHLRLGYPLGDGSWLPVVTGNDVHIVPVQSENKLGDYWIGATVEFPEASNEIIPKTHLLDEVLQQAISFCPELANATIIKKWSGLRPRPEQQPAPIIKMLSGYQNILLATGHYRNGILLAPTTALEVCQLIQSNHL